MNVRAKYRIRRWSPLLLAIVFTLMSLGLAGAQSDVYLPIVSNANRNQTIPPASSQSTSVTVVEESRSAVVAAPPKHTLETTSAVPQTTAVTNSNAPTWDKFGNFSVTGNIGAGIENPAERIHINGGPARFRINDTRTSPSGDPAFTFFTRGTQVGAMFFQDGLGDQMVLRAGTAAFSNSLIMKQPSSAGHTNRMIIDNNEILIPQGRLKVDSGTFRVLDDLSIQGRGNDEWLHMNSSEVRVHGRIQTKELVVNRNGAPILRTWSDNNRVAIGTNSEPGSGVKFRVTGGAIQADELVVTPPSGKGIRVVGAANQLISLESTNEGSVVSLIAVSSNNKKEAQIQYKGRFAFVRSGSATLLINEQDHVGIGTGSPAERLHVNGNVLADNVSVPSDIRLKTDIQRIDGALEIIANMEGVQYRFDLDNPVRSDLPEGEQIGFIAQDLEKILPEVVLTGSDGYKSVDYSKVTPVLVNAIQEQQAQFEAIEAENAQLRSELAEQQAQFEAIEAENAQLRSELAELKAVVNMLLEQQQADD